MELKNQKMSPWSIPRIVMIWDGWTARWTFPAPRRNRLSAESAERKKAAMNQVWKKLFALDFEREFTVSFLKLLLFWNPLWTLLVSLALGNRTLSSIFFRWGWSLSEATLVVLFGMAMARLFKAVEKVWSVRFHKNLPRHGTGWHLLFLAFVAPAGLYLALHVMVGAINFFYAGDPIPVEFYWKYIGAEVFWVWALLLLCFLFMSWQDLRDAARWSQLKMEEMEKERLQALLTKLKDQMNPHFLFNTLNTVASLIHDDPVKAEKVVVKLSALFQGVLTASRKSFHTLERELEFCRDYLEIEQVRFGPRLGVKIKMEKGLEPEKIFIPVLLLQPLVENAVKHGLSSRASGGNLFIKAGRKDGHLEIGVEDDGVGFGYSNVAGSGTALENCRKRLALGFGAEGQLQITSKPGKGTKVLLMMPLINSDPSPKEEK